MPQRTTEVHITAATVPRPEVHTAGAAALHRPAVHTAPAAAHSRAAHTVQAAAAAEVPAALAAVLHTGEDNVNFYENKYVQKNNHCSSTIVHNCSNVRTECLRCTEIFAAEY